MHFNVAMLKVALNWLVTGNHDQKNLMPKLFVFVLLDTKSLSTVITWGWLPSS